MPLHRCLHQRQPCYAHGYRKTLLCYRLKRSQGTIYHRTDLAAATGDQKAEEEKTKEEDLQEGNLFISSINFICTQLDILGCISHLSHPQPAAPLTLSTSGFHVRPNAIGPHLVNLAQGSESHSAAHLRCAFQPT